MYHLAVCYHYIGRRDRFPYPGINGITIEELNNQIEILSKQFTFIGVRELKKAIESRHSLPEYCATLTFDDGLREHYEEALPVLKRHGVPFIFFASSMPYSEKKALTVHKIHYLRSIVEPDLFLQQVIETASSLCGLALDWEQVRYEIPPNYYPYDDDKARIQKYLLNFHLPGSCRDRIIEHLFAKHCDESSFCRDFYMNVDQLKEVHHRYDALGLHCHSHVPLAALDDVAAEFEIMHCKEVLEELVGGQLSCVSYPYGYAQAVSLREERIAGKAGLSFGFTMEMCINRDITVAPHLLGRINNNEAPGNKQAIISCRDGKIEIMDENRMTYHRKTYYSDYIPAIL